MKRQWNEKKWLRFRFVGILVPECSKQTRISTKQFNYNIAIDVFETLDFCRNLLFLTKERALTIFDLLNYYLSLHDTYAKCISYNYLSLKSLLPRCTITNNGSLTYLHL